MVTFDTVIVTYRLCHSYKQIKLAVNAVSLSCMPITIFSFISSSLSLYRCNYLPLRVSAS